MRTLRSLLFFVLLLLCQTAWAAKGTLVFVPLDNRPVCLDYTVQTMEAAGWEVKTPPREFIANEKNLGKPEKMMEWLEHNADDAVAIVASSDALIYGGLVASRTHSIPLEVLQARDPASMRLCTLLDKPDRRVKPVEVHYTGFTIPDAFVVGYGLDYAERYRNLPYIGVLKPAVYGG